MSRFAYMRPQTTEELTRARAWESCCAWLSPWILYPEDKESVPEITIDCGDNIADVAEDKGSSEDHLQEDVTCTINTATVCTQVTPSVRFEDEATIAACHEASPSQTPTEIGVNQCTMDQDVDVKNTADGL